MSRRYESPEAFRTALTDKLRQSASNGPWTLPQLQRQIAYDRLLERLYAVDEGWIVKGATALLARDIGVRGSLDVDLYRAAAARVAESDLRAAVAKDLGDWFRFSLGTATGVGAGSGVRIPVDTFIGAATWSRFHVDLSGSDLRMTGQPDRVPPIVRVAIPGVEQHGYVAYPLVDHIADKIAATFEVHGLSANPSTRYRDLVDLVAILGVATIDAEPQSDALTSEFERRGIPLPARFSVPDRVLWESGYSKEAADSLLEVALVLDEALAVVSPFAGPLFARKAEGKWHPEECQWLPTS